MKFLVILFVSFNFVSSNVLNTLNFKNSCGADLWIVEDNFKRSKTKFKVDSGSSGNTPLVNTGYTRFWVKSNCDDPSGDNCWPGDDTIEGAPDPSAQNVGNTNIWFYYDPNIKWFNYVSYYIDLSYGFSFSVSVTPVGIQQYRAPQNPGSPVLTTYCRPLKFSAFPCPTMENLVEIGIPATMNNSMTLMSPANPTATPQVPMCLSPCAVIQYPNDVNEYLVDNNLFDAAKLAYCTGDWIVGSKLNDTEYLKTLRLTDSVLLNLNEGNNIGKMALCNATTYTVDITCSQATPINTSGPFNEQMLWY